VVWVVVLVIPGALLVTVDEELRGALLLVTVLLVAVPSVWW